MIVFGGNRKRSDKEIIEGIKKGGREEDICLKQLYSENFKPIMSFVLKNNGTEKEAREMLQQGIIVLYEKIKTSTFTASAKLSTYIFSVVKNQWYTHLKQKDKLIYAEPVQEKKIYQLNYQEEHVAKTDYVASLMQELKEDCREILILSIYQNYSMKEIAEMMGFKNEQIARNKKSKCLGYFKKLILKDSEASKILMSS